MDRLDKSAERLFITGVLLLLGVTVIVIVGFMVWLMFISFNEMIHGDFLKGAFGLLFTVPVGMILTGIAIGTLHEEFKER